MQLQIFKYQSEEEQLFNEIRTIEQEDGNEVYHAGSWQELEKIVNEIKGEESERKPIEHKNIRGKEYFK